MRRRALALPTVLGVIAVLLTLGLALCTLSTVSLNLARHNYLEARAQLLARSGLAEFVAQMRRIEATLPLPPAIPTTDLATSFADVEIVPGCHLGFRPGLAYKSTDNLYSEFPQAGYVDRGTTAKSVPPFTLEVILHVEVEGVQREFRALVRRVWPYAAYVDQGPLVLCGWPDAEVAPTHVDGSVYKGRNWPGPMFENETDPDAQSPRLWVTRRELTRCMVMNVPGAVTLGPHLSQNLAFNPYGPTGSTTLPNACIAGGTPHWFKVSAVNRAPLQVPPGSGTADPGNHLEGSADLDDDLSALGSGAVFAAAGNRFDGTVLYKDPRLDPLDLLRPSFMAPGTVVTGLPLVTPGFPDPRDTYVLNRTLALDGSTTSRWEIDGNLVSRMIWPPLDPGEDAGTVIVESYPAGLELRDCSLHVKGDLDLWRPLAQDPTYTDYPPTVLSGTNATLIVDGTLTLGGGRLDSHDQGMVIYARHLVMRAGGDFRGLIVADRSASVLPDGTNHLSVRGGIVCGGVPGAEGLPGMVLRSMDLKHDPRYLKTLHSIGTFRLTGWQQL